MFLRPLVARKGLPSSSGLLAKWTALQAAWPPPSSEAHSGMQGRLMAACLSCLTWRGLATEAPQDWGQPSPGTHPEAAFFTSFEPFAPRPGLQLLAPGDITPGISAAEYAARRSALLALLPPRSAAILSAAPPMYMAGIIPYPYRQDADFLYLTGCQQPGGVAVLEKRGGGDVPHFAMFMPTRDVMRERWDGPLADPSAALALFGANAAPRLEQLGAHVASLLSAGVQLFYDGRAAEGGAHRALPALGRASEQGLVRPLRPLVHRLRWKKSPAEIERMRAVSAITAAAFKESMRVSLESLHEHTVAATFEHQCKRRGAQRMAYPPVVGGGRNGCYIHYSRHDRQVRPGELLTMDAGCELHGYATDVTRSWPVSGTFTQHQARVYSAVLSVWRECLSLCRPGRTLHDIHSTSVALLTLAMAEFGAPLGSRLPHMRPYTRFYAHSVGHWLGMDTHDCATVSLTTPLEPGVVLALEPGLYFPAHPDTPPWLWDIGIRIEDDVLITEGEPEVLSQGVPREVDEIEALLQESVPVGGS